MKDRRGMIGAGVCWIGAIILIFIGKLDIAGGLAFFGLGYVFGWAQREHELKQEIKNTGDYIDAEGDEA